MSSHPVKICQIDSIEAHPNADRLEIANIFGWQTIVPKGEFVSGSNVIYIPIDSVFDSRLEEYLFPPESKIRLKKSRVRSTRIRSAISQGMAVGLTQDLFNMYPELTSKSVGDDVADIIGVTKYEPPEPHYHVSPTSKKRIGKNPKYNPMFVKYTDIENYKYHTKLFGEDEHVYITEKVHGTSARYARYPRKYKGVSGFFKKMFVKFGIMEPTELCYGSRNVQLQTGGRIFYQDNVYAYVLGKFRLDKVLQPGEALYGEILGEGIQKGYSYGFKKGEWGFFAYDVRVGDKYLDAYEFENWCDSRGIPRVPVLYQGKMGSADLAMLRSGRSYLAPESQLIQEGIVIKPITEQPVSPIGRKILKNINDDFLLGDQTDFH